MSTQNEAGIEFAVVPEQYQDRFRLLELPSELLDLLSKKDAQPLYFKSASIADGETISPPTVTLCTNDKTYAVRQVNTSNSVYVARPGIVRESEQELDLPSLEAFAQCDSFLEIQPQASSSAVSYLRSLVPVYSSTGHYGGKPAVLREEVFANIPLSEAECEESWIDLACFEMQNRAGCFIPSAAARVDAWKAILTNATANSIDLTSPIAVTEKGNVIDNANELPSELSHALLRSVCSQADGLTFTIDQLKCTRMVGASHLETHLTTGLAISQFKEEWADLLPEKWRGSKGPDLEALKGCYRLEGTNIVFTETGAVEAVKDPKTSLGAKRAWHEKFRQSKKPAT